MKKLTDEMWMQGRLYHHYQRHRRGRIRIDTSLLEILRDREWKRQHALIAAEVAALMPMTLTPPEALRERNHETGTVYDARRTVRCNSEPLS